MVYGQSVEWRLWPLWNWWNWSSNWKLKLKPGPNRRYVLRLGQLKKFHIGAQTLCENSLESSSPPFAEGIWCCLTCYSAWQKLCTATGNNGSFTKRVTVRERGRKGDSMYCTPCSILGKGRELSLQQLQLISFHVSLVCFLSNVLYLIEERCDCCKVKSSWLCADKHNLQPWELNNKANYSKCYQTWLCKQVVAYIQFLRKYICSKIYIQPIRITFGFNFGICIFIWNSLNLCCVHRTLYNFNGFSRSRTTCSVNNSFRIAVNQCGNCTSTNARNPPRNINNEIVSLNT